MTARATSSGSVPFVLGAVLCLAAWLGGDPGNGSLAPAAMAQGFSLSGGDSDAPIAIEAEQGIEWQREKQVYIARGNARASRGDVTVYADSLTAHYRSDPGGGTEIWRLEANGNVRITSRMSPSDSMNVAASASTASSSSGGVSLHDGTPTSSATKKL